MKIDVSGVGHEPDFFGISRALNKHLCIAGSRVPVFLATDDEHRGLEIADVRPLGGDEDGGHNCDDETPRRHRN